MTTTPTTATTKKAQDMIAVSADFKDFIVEQTTIFGASSASKDYMAATQKEVCDAMLEFVKAHRITGKEPVELETFDVDGQPIVDSEGNPVMETVERDIDGFALEMSRTLALRAATSRANSASAKLAEKEKELQELREMLAKLQSVQA